MYRVRLKSNKTFRTLCLVSRQKNRVDGENVPWTFLFHGRPLPVYWQQRLSQHRFGHESRFGSRFQFVRGENAAIVGTALRNKILRIAEQNFYRNPWVTQRGLRGPSFIQGPGKCMAQGVQGRPRGRRRRTATWEAFDDANGERREPGS